MSWSVGFAKPVSKHEAESMLDNLAFAGDATKEGPAYDQFKSAKATAKLLLRSVPGPYVMVTMSGHANGVGWHKKEGMANDMISVNVTQICEEDLQYYAK